MSTASEDTWKVTPYTPAFKAWPYKPIDFTRRDESPDAVFYKDAKLVTHIDDNAINAIRRYYDTVLPEKGRILDFCSSWVSHYPARVKDAAKSGAVAVVGLGMNPAELERNPILSERVVQDLNGDPVVKTAAPFDASTCVVSIDYLNKPLEVLASIRENTVPGGTVHLAISNRAFWDKVVRRWLVSSEGERVTLVCDYLYFSGWRDVEVVQVVEKGEGGGGVFGMFGAAGDPVWVVRGRNVPSE
jgi:hypothetical protein